MSDILVNGVFTSEEGVPLTSPSTEAPPSGDSGLDYQWVRTAFVLPTKDRETGADNPNIDPFDAANRYWSPGSIKFTDGRFGCNIGINCQPQITAYADTPAPSRLKGRPEPEIDADHQLYGMGGFWSSAFDDAEEIAYLRFGVPEFNSLLNFFTGAYDYGSSVLARTGRLPSFVYNVSHLLGSYAAFKAFPLISIAVAVYRVADYFYFRQSAKYYNMKPTMHLYWSTVNTMVNTMAINMGIFPKILSNEDTTQKLGMPFGIDDDQMAIFHEMAPDIFSSNNYIDVFALATRAQRVANQVVHDEFESHNSGSATDWTGYLQKTLTGDGKHSTLVADRKGDKSLMQWLEEATAIGDFYRQDTKDASVEQKPEAAKDQDTYNPLYSKSSWDNFAKHLTAEFRQGGNFAVFRVSNSKSKSESFSNNTQPSSLENKMNSVVSNFQEHRFTLGGVQAAAGDLVNKATSLAQDAIMGALDGVAFGIPSSIMGLLGEGYVEIPEHWQSSSSSLPSAQFKISLDAWNGSPLTRLMKLYVPFCMIAAGAWPRSVGRQAYTAPFLCQLYNRGRVQVPLGMITEFTVSRGEGNIGFTTEGAPLSINISFTVKDLSRVLHMPLMAGDFFQKPAYVDEESTVVNYLATVAGQSMYSQIYPASKAKVRAAKLAMKSGMMTSSAYWASTIYDFTTNTFPIGLLYEGIQRNPDVVAGSM